MWREYHEQHDIKYRLLSFLLHLATSPLEKEYSPLESSSAEEESEIDWRQVLREGEASLSPLGSESDLSDWSLEEEERQVTVGEEREDPGEAGGRGGGEEPPAPDPETWLREEVQFPYWAEEQVVRVESKERSANIARITERLREEEGELKVRTNKLTEYQVIRELVWVLRSPVETPLFTLTAGQFQVSKKVTIPSLTDTALQSLLGQAVGMINDVHTLKCFLGDIENISDDVPRTFEAYCSGLNVFLQSFSLDLFKLETDVRKQEESLTVLRVLDRLLPWSKMISGYRTLHDLATKDWKTALNWERSIRLLSVLHSSLTTNHLPSLLPFLVDTFLRSLEPFLNIINTWLVEGRLEDWSQEFIFFKDQADEEDEDFFNHVFRPRPYKELLGGQKIVPLKLLDGLDQKILVSGKSVEILSKLDKKTRDLTEMATNSSVGLFQEFVTRLEDQLPKKKSSDLHVNVKSDQQLDPEFEAILSSAGDPYLARAFQQVFLSAQETRSRSGHDIWAPELLLPHSELSCLLPLEILMARSLSPTIDSHYLTACTRLVDLFKTDLQLDSVLSQARKVFFLEAGDLMQEFCSQLFTSLEAEDELETSNSASLTLLLQDCLGTRYPAWADLFSCTIEPQTQEAQDLFLSGLRIHQAVSWPLNMVLSQQNLLTYNKIFLFLAGVKRSLWALHTVSLQQLEALESSMLDTEDLSVSCLQPQDDPNLSLCSGAKQHRLQLLRSWLIFFSSSLHGYFMSRVVHSTELELRDNLHTATDLHQIISVHQLYLQQIYDKCFLHSSVATLREAVLMVLGIGIDLRRSVMSGLPIHSRTVVAWEEKYRKCHIFLASSLKAITKKRKVPHLEGLAVTLLHSCPS